MKTQQCVKKEHKNVYHWLIWRTCCILSKSKHGLWGRCSLCGACRGGRRRGETAQWNSFAGGLIDLTSIEMAGLSHEILILSIPRPLSVRMSGVVERWCINIIWPRFGLSASSGGDVRKLTTGAGTCSSKLRTCGMGQHEKSKNCGQKMLWRWSRLKWPKYIFYIVIFWCNSMYIPRRQSFEPKTVCGSRWSLNLIVLVNYHRIHRPIVRRCHLMRAHL